MSENLHEEGVVGFDPTTLLSFISALFQCLAKNDPKPKPPEPAADVDTDEKREAWQTSYTAKQLVDANYQDGKYTPLLVTRTARQVKREQGKTSKEERKRVARELLDETRLMSHRELYEAALEAR